MIGQPQRHFGTIGSTNDAAREWARDGAPHGAIVMADTQTSGRGRRGREWSSPAGKGLYLSLIVRPDDGLEVVPRLTMLASLAAVRTLKREQIAAQTKWPNDVLLNGRKIAGVLSEAEMRDNKLDFALVGIGLNINFERADLPPRAIYPASSLLLETARLWDILAMRDAWLQEFGTLYHRLPTDWKHIRDEFWRDCAQANQMVEIKSETETWRGVAVGLDEDGALLVQTQTAVRRVLAGDVSPLIAKS